MNLRLSLNDTKLEIWNDYYSVYGIEPTSPIFNTFITHAILSQVCSNDIKIHHITERAIINEIIGICNIEKHRLESMTLESLKNYFIETCRGIRYDITKKTLPDSIKQIYTMIDFNIIPKIIFKVHLLRIKNKAVV